MLRIFKAKRLLRHYLENAVVEAASRLGITMVSLLLVAAGLFYELEKYGVSRPCSRHL
jgi:hypothetical protein